MKNRPLLIAGALSLALAGTIALAAPALAHGPGGMGRGFGLGPGADRGDQLAQELGISVDQLHAAQERAMAKRLADAVKAGRLTQEQADQMLAARKLEQAIDHDAVLAQALGISAADLKAARDAGKDLRDILTEKNIDRQAFQSKLQTAMAAAVAKAVTDGVITQAQADALKAQRAEFGHGLRGGGFGRPGMPGGRDGRGIVTPGQNQSQRLAPAPSSDNL